jgi:hypothetical protein
MDRPGSGGEDLDSFDIGRDRLRDRRRAKKARILNIDTV